MKTKIALLLFLAAPAWAVTCPSGYNYYQVGTVDHTQAGSSDSNNFTLLVSTSDNKLATTGNGGHVTNANGYDIIFSSASDGSYALHFESETYTSTNGTINYWVNVGTVSHSSNGTLYMFYGNSGVSTWQGGSVGSAWDSHYVAVYHLPNGSTLSGADSTSNGNNGTVTGATATSGEIDGAASFTASSMQYIDVGNAPSIQVQMMTLSAWVYLPDTNGIYSIYGGSGGSDGYPELRIYNGGYMQFLAQGVAYIGGASGNFGAGAFHLIGITFDGTNGTFYIDGSSAGSVSATTVFTYGSDTVQLGKGYGTGEYFNGTIDEERVSNSVRGADWILTEYNNQKSNSTMVTWGAENSCGGTAPVYTPNTEGMTIQSGKTKIQGGKIKVQ